MKGVAGEVSMPRFFHVQVRKGILGKKEKGATICHSSYFEWRVRSSFYNAGD
jgi:hypothetical protein